MYFVIDHSVVAAPNGLAMRQYAELPSAVADLDSILAHENAGPDVFTGNPTEKDRLHGRPVLLWESHSEGRDLFLLTAPAAARSRLNFEVEGDGRAYYQGSATMRVRNTVSGVSPTRGGFSVGLCPVA